MAIDSLDTHASAYTDRRSLDKLREQSNSAPGEALDEVARQFEGMFLKMVLKSMREAQLSEGLFSSNAVKMNQDMYDTQMAQQLSSGNGLGFSKALRAQLGAFAGVDDSNSKELPISADALSRRTPLPRYHGLAPTAASPATSPATNPATNPATSNPTASSPANGPAATQGLASIQQAPFESPEQFIQTLWPAATRVAPQLGVKPEVLLAQAAHETGWGKFIPQHDNGQSSHNLFGIKTGSQWSGDHVTKNTLEVLDGVPQQQRADFRSYPSFESSFEDYGKLISGKSRYQQALAHADSPAQYLHGLQSGGYATDPDYAERIMSLLNGSRFQNAIEKVQSTPVDQASIASQPTVSGG